MEIVKWVAESCRPFGIVCDPGFKRLMKTGRPRYYLPSPSTVSRNVKMVFVRTRQCVANLLQVRGMANIDNCTRTHMALQEHPGKLSFGTDAWMSPNHRAFVAITVHLEHKGQSIRMLLDMVEVIEVHYLQLHGG